MERVGFNVLLGKTVESIIRGEFDQSESLTLNCADGESYMMCHHQDCCESVGIDDICGDLGDLVGAPILFAEESSQDTPPEGVTEKPYEQPEWTFYRVRTNKGSVVIRWFGQSDYYSTRVAFYKL